MRYPYKVGAIGSTAIAILLSAAPLWAQTSRVRARDLYFEADGAVSAGGTAPDIGTSTAGKSAAGKSDTGKSAPGKSTEVKSAAEKQPVVPAVHRLGLRYNLLQVNPTTRESHAVDPDANFSRGDCFAVEFSPNRDGHLYIFNRGSSGEWQLLLPSAAMPDEASLVKAGKTARVPQEYCFMLNDPPGVETLVVAVTERQEDIDQLRQAMRGAGRGGDAQPDMKAVRNDVQKWQQQMGGRDLYEEKLDQPESAGEQPHSVYVVRTTAGESTRLVIEIKIRHE